ncbi:hypothetical protein BU26DRAFT_602844 [Trematosphaeria pertusa]|uniref:Uncharacterized protein n=1 Tax=Trematosphaeria pertusa TaxID=390896 RepID=A0A6A6IRP0_9PLEO|nr:uncharacterized protein BU26DRAFT_602844 [Trematosphaeria pertusa]KAF2252472.1 hypothetical protein BU26DRAFT_602844 [Trematosphaeria pertusa]
MHAKLFLTTSFAASVLAAPLPATPIESPVEDVEPLMVRDARPSAVISPIPDNMKREILERLDAMAQIKPAGTNEKREHIEGAANTNDKREPEPVGTAGAASTNEKRQKPA